MRLVAPGARRAHVATLYIAALLQQIRRSFRFLVPSSRLETLRPRSGVVGPHVAHLTAFPANIIAP
jgi:hypothetical protein